MRIAYGHTRFVILVGDKAIKVARLRLLRSLSRFVVLPFSQKRRDHFFGKYGSSFGRALWNDLWDGLFANQGEYEYYERFHDPRVIPTLTKLLGGWIVIQQRGEPIRSEECPDIFRSQAPENDMSNPAQYARSAEGSIVLVDYGKGTTREALQLLPR